MSAPGKQEAYRLGFLTAIEVPDKGYVGGLLVTTHHGRPLEFQCTLPVRPNATQTILYGPTLASFVLGELIGGTLLDKAGIKPNLVLTDCEPILELRNHVEWPVVWVTSAPDDQSNASDESSASPVEAGTTNESLRLGGQVLRFHAAHGDDRPAVETGAKRLPADADLQEPFQRVREALQETLRLGALK